MSFHVKDDAKIFSFIVYSWLEYNRATSATEAPCSICFEDAEIVFFPPIKIPINIKVNRMLFSYKGQCHHLNFILYLQPFFWDNKYIFS